MKFLIITLALLGAVVADVSHLNNDYLPPHKGRLVAHHRHVEYAQQSQEIPQVSTVEVSDNSVVEDTAAASVQEQVEDQKYFTGKIQIDNLNYGPGYAGDVEVHTQEKPYHTGAIVIPHPEVPTAEEATEEKKYYTGLVYKQGQEGAAADTTTSNDSDSFAQQQAAHTFSQNQEATQESESVAPGSDAFTQQQAAHYTSISAQQEEGASGADSSSATVVDEQAQSPEKEYYTGLVYKPGQEAFDSTSTSTTTEVEQQQAQEPEKQYYTGLVYKPGQEAFDSTSTSTSTEVQQQQAQEPEKQYYTGLVNKPGQESASHVEQHSQSAIVPGSDDFTQQQAAYWTQQDQKPEQQYHTGLVYKPGQEEFDSTHTSTTTQVEQQQAQEPEKQYYTGLVHKPGQESVSHVAQHSQTVVAPGSDDFTQQQAAYYTSGSQQHVFAPAVGSSSGIDTQYSADGGYVY